jgi:hypothetical protein
MKHPHHITAALAAVCAAVRLTAFSAGAAGATTSPTLTTRTVHAPTGHAGAVSPRYSGGGCNYVGLYYNGTWEATVESCVGESSSTIDSQAEIYDASNVYESWSYVSVRDDSIPTTVARTGPWYGYGYSGRWYGWFGAYYGATSGHSYHTYVWTTLELTDGTYVYYNTGDTAQNSPEMVAS